MSGALIVTAELAPADFAFFDGLRKVHFPPERNRIGAHLTMFHALPPTVVDEAKAALKTLSAGPPPGAMVAGLMNLGGGVAYRIVSEDLDFIRADLAQQFLGLLTAQDGQGWRPHITVQNKVTSSVARALMASLEQNFAPRPLAIAGLGLHRYMDGPWDTIARYPFRGSGRRT
ncbi:2'-5' RNA ligase family protein [Sphingomonas sp. LY29]|uniref:2'-5' RNA ligase family protein n=1 Tax=Sphingomonas sp. LY29 TaxID=3095341 RepID=UPI002D777B6C|nr:2'-5' RNA ligase family protein [Sphingomonas sp. LY29]WRP26177.1 2'-5' RNA ligase family protein [Sphingomonas sp. LY29]